MNSGSVPAFSFPPPVPSQDCMAQTCVHAVLTKLQLLAMGLWDSVRWTALLQAASRDSRRDVLARRPVRPAGEAWGRGRGVAMCPVVNTRCVAPRRPPVLLLRCFAERVDRGEVGRRAVIDGQRRGSPATRTSLQAPGARAMRCASLGSSDSAAEIDAAASRLPAAAGSLKRVCDPGRPTGLVVFWLHRPLEQVTGRGGSAHTLEAWPHGGHGSRVEDLRRRQFSAGPRAASAAAGRGRCDAERKAPGERHRQC